MRENAKLTPEARDAAVDDLIALVGAVDGILQAQAAADTHYFVEVCSRPLTATELDAVKTTVLAAYRWQYIVSGVQSPEVSRRAGQHDHAATERADRRGPCTDRRLIGPQANEETRSWQ